MPWLDTGIESGNVIVDRYALAGYRNRIYNRLLTDVSWVVAGVDLEFFRHALAGYRNRIWKSPDVPWLDTGIESGNVVNRYALAGYRSRIFKLFRHALARYRNRIRN